MSRCIEFGCQNVAPVGFALCDECAERVYGSIGRNVSRILSGKTTCSNEVSALAQVGCEEGDQRDYCFMDMLQEKMIEDEKN